MRAKKVIFVTLSVLVFIQVFLIDIVLKSLGPDRLGLYAAKQALLIAGLSLFYLIINKSELNKERNSVSKIGALLLLVAGVMVLFGIITFLPHIEFEYNSNFLQPGNYFTVISANIFSVIILYLTVYIFVILKNFIFSYRRKETVRNFILLSAAMIATSITYFNRGLESEDFLSIPFFIICIILMLIHSFRLPWVIYLTRKEKYYTIAYLLFLCPLIIVASVLIGSSPLYNNQARILFYISPIIKEFVFLSFIFTSIYLSISFISTIFHLPTQDIFDRKIVEISSLHNLSRLVTQAFDFRELIEEINKLSLTVCEASCTWIEISNEKKESDNEYSFYIAGSKNITGDEIKLINSYEEKPFNKTILSEKKFIYRETIDSKHYGNETLAKKLKSLVAFPLISHTELIGILYIGSNRPYGFDKEYFNIISTFADQVTISIENSRLIQKSIEKERMERELLLAQKMQKKLLPQKFPEHQHLDLFATTIPAYEVGGDFYDFSMINEDKIGIIVGDVSGKGISAAFYMALIKGMFQALSKIYESPKDLLISMNKSIYGHIEKNSFVSLIYGVLDLITGKLYLSRAGHCPMVLISDQESKFVKPLGMGIGLDRGDIFSNTLEQMEIELTKDTTCVFYTDGITEARSKTGDEFGFQRLFNSIITNNDCKADNICNNVIKDVKSFTETESEFDDITLVIFKWKIN
jgi:phosphoserine phosphatase RsbU/P